MSNPVCPDCKQPMARRIGERGEFWGCPRFPECRGTRPYIAPPPPPIPVAEMQRIGQAERAASELAIREDWIAVYPDATSEIMACPFGAAWLVLRLRLTAEAAERGGDDPAATWCRRRLADMAAEAAAATLPVARN